MKRTFKKPLLVLGVVLLVVVLLLIVWAFLIYPKFILPREKTAATSFNAAKIAEEAERIDFNEDKGVLYVNNEVVVFFKEGAEEQAASFLSQLDADVDDTMADIGFYRLTFEGSMTYEQLEDLVAELNTISIVESAYLNTVTEFEQDDVTEKKAVFPNDPWNGDPWNVQVPRGENWGMEAIDAPGAWGYLDQLATVKVGLIDSKTDDSHPDLTVVNSSCLFIDEKTGQTHINKYTIEPEDHGTHVAGTMNATWNNETGVSGVMGGKGELYHCLFRYDVGDSYTWNFATAYTYLLAIKHLIDQDVQVINISQNTSRLIGFAASKGNENAINYLTAQADMTQKGLARIIQSRQAANKPDFVICVAAGNNNHITYYKDDNEPYGYRTYRTSGETTKSSFGWEGETGGALALYNNFLNLMDNEEVKKRVIVVGAVGIDAATSTDNKTQYSYAYFSNIGDRVDIVAPGVDIYSCVPASYGNSNGTSMATPHVAGVAGLVFASNPKLTGPEVKQLLIASASGRYYHGDDYSGLLNAKTAVINALKTLSKPVAKVIRTEVNSGLDLCFVVDTTGSMEDDIDNAKENMADILDHLADKTENYRVALIDYRDYSERTFRSYDYPCKIQLPFTDDNASIISAINGLTLGYGGDENETVYSALMEAVDLDWRSEAKKAIIILGDAPPLDPEPFSNYTYDDVLLALFTADISLDYEKSDKRVVGGLETSLINVYSIGGAHTSADAADFFDKIASSTGGEYFAVDDASQVSDAIIESIEDIEVEDKVTVQADFGRALAHQQIDLHSDSEFLFSFTTDEMGRFNIADMPVGSYEWTSNSIYGSGLLDINPLTRTAIVHVTGTYWFTPILEIWQQHTVLVCVALSLYVGLCIALPLLIRRARRSRRGKPPHRAPNKIQPMPSIEPNYVPPSESSSAYRPFTGPRYVSPAELGHTPPTGQGPAPSIKSSFEPVTGSMSVPAVEPSYVLPSPESSSAAYRSMTQPRYAPPVELSHVASVEPSYAPPAEHSLTLPTKSRPAPQIKPKFAPSAEPISESPVEPSFTPPEGLDYAPSAEPISESPVEPSYFSPLQYDAGLPLTYGRTPSVEMSDVPLTETSSLSTAQTEVSLYCWRCGRPCRETERYCQACGSDLYEV